MPPPKPRLLTGIVVTAGRMTKAVKVRTTRPIYDRAVRKAFRVPTAHLVSDPTTALRAGDVVRFAPWPTSRRVRHVVTEIVAPWGPPIAERPAVLTEAERLEAKRAKTEVKRLRRLERKAAEKAEGAGGKKKMPGPQDMAAAAAVGMANAEAKENVAAAVEVEAQVKTETADALGAGRVVGTEEMVAR